MSIDSSLKSMMALLLASIIASACSSEPKKPTADELLAELRKRQLETGKACERVPIEVFLQASPYINQNAEGQSMPVEVRVLLLKGRETFDQLDFETLWQRGEEALGEDLVKSASLTVFPGKLKIYTMKSDPQVGYVALVGIFRKPKIEARDWMYLLDVREQNRRCATPDALHTIVHALLRDNRLEQPETDAAESKEP